MRHWVLRFSALLCSKLRLPRSSIRSGHLWTQLSTRWRYRLSLTVSELTSLISPCLAMTKFFVGISVSVRNDAALAEACNILQCGEPSTVRIVISFGLEHLMRVASFSVSPLNPSACGQDVKVILFLVNSSQSFGKADCIHSPMIKTRAPLRNGALTHVSISFKPNTAFRTGVTCYLQTLFTDQ